MAKSEMMRGMLFGAEFFTQLYKKVTKLGGNEEIMYAKMKDESFVEATAKLIMAGANGVKNVLRILANLPLADRIARGKYDWTNPDITEVHFPTSVPTDYDAEYKLFHFDRGISSEDAIREMEREGFRPGTLAELLALGEAQPELQKQFPVIALSSVWRDSDGDRRVPGLRWGGGRRELRLFWFEFDWDADCRFLAVRK